MLKLTAHHAVRVIQLKTCQSFNSKTYPLFDMLSISFRIKNNDTKINFSHFMNTKQPEIL